MCTHNTYVRARIETETKERVAYALEKMGLSNLTPTHCGWPALAHTANYLDEIGSQ